MLWDVANHMPLCAHHHNRHERALERVPREVVSDLAWVFAEGLGLTHVLETLYPRRVISANA